jgi:hypothetical protein
MRFESPAAIIGESAKTNDRESKSMGRKDEISRAPNNIRAILTYVARAHSLTNNETARYFPQARETSRAFSCSRVGATRLLASLRLRIRNSLRAMLTFCFAVIAHYREVR